MILPQTNIQFLKFPTHNRSGLTFSNQHVIFQLHEAKFQFQRKPVHFYDDG